MVCPVLALLLFARVGAAHRLWLVVALVMTGFVSIVVGLLQIGHVGGLSWSLYSYYHEGFLDGFQANRNAQADVLSTVIMGYALLSLAMIVSNRQGGARVWPFVVLGLLIGFLSLFMCGSRMGIALMPVSLLVSLAILWPALRMHVRRPWLWLGGALLLVAVAGAVLAAILQSTRCCIAFPAPTKAASISGRIPSLPCGGLALGGGIGSFPNLFNAVERLETVRRTLAPARTAIGWNGRWNRACRA
jgi:hypothetical protein